MSTFKSFEDLECWKECAALRKELSVVVKEFPPEEKNLLVAQIRRASRGATNSIAEGFGRFLYPEFAEYYKKSRGFLYELVDHLTVAFEEGHISQEQLKTFSDKTKKCLIILDSLVNHLLQKENNDLKTSGPEINYDVLSESTNQRNN
jgi:four helix bundle protein